jgi:uncharacterized radical SAM superfamily protein
MVDLNPESVWNADEKEFLSLIDSGLFKRKSKEVRFYAPSFTYYKTNYYCSSPEQFPTISVTGSSCALNCKHCGGKVLETMQAASTPNELFDLSVKLKKNGANGCLVSGGCNIDGSVPLTPFASTLERMKRELGLTVFVHTGIINAESAVMLKRAGVDAALIDIIGSQETLNKIYNLKANVQDFADSLKALQEAGLHFVPHVIMGLNDGKLDGEFNALKLISTVKPSALVIIAFMPIHGTAMAQVKPPKPTDIARTIATAKLMFPQTPLVLGCMRPKGKLRIVTDILALKAGVDAIAFPSEDAVKYAESQGLKFSFSPYCCAQIYMDAAFRSASK